MFKEKFGTSERSGGFGGRRHSDEFDTELTSSAHKPEELDGSPYGRRKVTKEQPDGGRQGMSHAATQQSSPDGGQQGISHVTTQQSSPVRPPSPPVPPPDEISDPLPDKFARQKEASKQALSTILNTVAAKHGKRPEEEPRYSFSSASSTDEMLPPPPLPIEPPPPQRTTPEKQLMTSTLFDRFSSTKAVSSSSGKGKQIDRRSNSPEKTPSPTPKGTTSQGRQNNFAPEASTSSYGLPNPYEYYHQPLSKNYSPEVPSHPFSPGPHDSPSKSGMPAISQGQVTPPSTASDSPPTFKTMAKGELRSIEISSPVFLSSSNQNVRPAYEQYPQYAAPTSSSGRKPTHLARQPQPLSATNLQNVVYEYDAPSAPPAPRSPSSPQNFSGSQSNIHEKSRPKPLTLLHESSEGARRTIEEILTQEIDQDSPSSAGQSSGPTRSDQQSNTGSGAGRKPLSAAAAVAEILANRQPLSVRISIQKHKTETSYKKSQSFGPDGQSGGGSAKGHGGGGKKNENPFSESSL